MEAPCDSISVEDSTQTDVLLPSEIIAKKIVDCKNVDGKRYYKVKWEPTWELEETLIDSQDLIEQYWSFLKRVEAHQKRAWPGGKRPRLADDGTAEGQAAAPNGSLIDSSSTPSGSSSSSQQLSSPSEILGLSGSSAQTQMLQAMFGGAQFTQLQAMLNSPPVLFMIAQALGMTPNAAAAAASPLFTTYRQPFTNPGYVFNGYGSFQASQTPAVPQVRPSRGTPHVDSHVPSHVSSPHPQHPLQLENHINTSITNTSNSQDIQIKQEPREIVSTSPSGLVTELQPATITPQISQFRIQVASPAPHESSSLDLDKTESLIGYAHSPVIVDVKSESRPRTSRSSRHAKDDDKEQISSPGLHRVRNFDNPYAKVIFVCKICKEELEPHPRGKWKEHSLTHGNTDESSSEDQNSQSETSPELIEWDAVWGAPNDGSAALGVEGIRYMEAFKDPYVNVLLVCKICKKEQEPKYSRNWKMHYLSHLPNEERPHRCSLCGDGYVRPDRLRRHIQQQHPEEALKSIAEQHTPLTLMEEASLPEYKHYMAAVQPQTYMVPKDELVPDEKDDSKTWVKL